jgi:hypothetical protein
MTVAGLDSKYCVPNIVPVYRTAMTNSHALWPASRTGSIDDISRIIGRISPIGYEWLKGSSELLDLHDNDAAGGRKLRDG